MYYNEQTVYCQKNLLSTAEPETKKFGWTRYQDYIDRCYIALGSAFETHRVCSLHKNLWLRLNNEISQFAILQMNIPFNRKCLSENIFPAIVGGGGGIERKKSTRVRYAM